MNEVLLNGFQKKQCNICSESFYKLFEFEQEDKEKFYICKECRTTLSLKWKGSVARNKFIWFDETFND